MVNLKNKKALVTGVSSGIGEEVVSSLATKNIQVFGVDRIQPKYKLEHFKKSDLGATVPSFDFGNIMFDYIIHVAGGADIKEITSAELVTDRALITKILEQNLISAIDVVASTKNKINANGSITFISSINAYSDYGLPIYSAAKAGLEGLMNGLLPELSEDYIRVNVAALGTVETEGKTDLYRTNPEKLIEALKDIPPGVTPYTAASVAEEIVEVALSNHTGQVFVLDRGQMEYKRSNRTAKVHWR